MSKHTPGPWNIGTKNGARVWSENGETLIADADASESLRKEIKKANARLIAAAPELLAAAQAAKLALDDLLHAKDGRDWWTQRDAAMMLIDAAIAKATGDAT